MANRAFKIVLIIGIIAVIFSGLYRFVYLDKQSPASVITSSSLQKVVNIAELSTAEFKYTGIAEVYSDEARTKLKCHVCYNAVVKAGIDMNEVQFDVDADNKTVAITLPDIDIKVTIVDEKEMDTLPSDADVGLNSMLKFSKEDAANEARASDALIDTARENLKSTIEGLLYPVLIPQGYSIIWN